MYVRTSWMTPRQRTLVSLAGPVVNLALAVVLLVRDRRCSWDPSHAVFWSGMAFLGFLQVTAFVLNLLPIPGLDGYGALEPHLSPRDAARAGSRPKQWGILHPAAPAVRAAAQPVVLRAGVLVLRRLRGAAACWWQPAVQLTRFWSAWF